MPGRRCTWSRSPADARRAGRAPRWQCHDRRVVGQAWEQSAARGGPGSVLGEKTVRLVLDVGRDRGEGFGVGTRVVGAEEELAGGELHSYVGLSAAAIAAVGHCHGFGR